MGLEYINEISVEDYMKLRKEVGWKGFPKEQAEIGLKNTAYLVACKDTEDHGNIIGMARLLWDGGYSAYIADVIVSPQYQKQGIGKEMMNRIMMHLKEQMQPGWRIMLTLMSAKGKEAFYEKFGFEVRPSGHFGAGMMQWIEKE